MQFDWEKHLKEALEASCYCCMATMDAEPWSNPVYFAYDGNFNFYFISMPRSKHMRNIGKNKKIAVSIYDSTQDTHGDVVGVQIEATARILDSPEEAEQAYAVYYSRVYPETKRDPRKEPKDYLGPEAEWRFVKIEPQSIWYFDTGHFGEERQEVPKHIYQRGK